MRFAVTATTSTGAKFWLTAPNSGGERALGTQTNAQIFENRDDALGAIAKLPGDFISAGFRVSVEPLDTDARIDCRS
jgi:hypothetical protein